MRKKVLFVLAFFLPCILVFLNPVNLDRAFGQASNPQGSVQTEVQAQVGDFFLNLSGIASPFASIVVTSDNTFLKSGVADLNGNFDISSVLIKKGFSNFCIEVIDFKRIGSSITCFSIPPATQSITMRDLFLPPTLGLFRAQIEEGFQAIIFGYTIPKAIVSLYFDNGKKFTTLADATGYYKFEISGLKAGTYKLYSKGDYKDKESLTPTKKAELRSVSKKKVSIGPLLIAIPIIILIIILIVLVWRLLKRRKKLHHWWFVGY